MFKNITLGLMIASVASVEVEKADSFYGDSFVTPALTPYSTRSGQRPAKTDYKVPNFGLDQDIVATHKHEKDVSKKYGAWNPKQDKDGVWIVPKEDAFFRIWVTNI